MVLFSLVSVVVSGCGGAPAAAPKAAPTGIIASAPAPSPVVSMSTPVPPPTVAALPVASPVASPVAAEGPPPLQRLRIGNTGGSGANLRGEPSPRSERIKLLLDGALVDLVDPGQEIAGTVWREIRDETGATGWISAEFLVPVTAVEIRVSPLPISSGGPPAQAGATGTRVPPIDRLTCPESHPVKAVGVGGLRYYPSTHGQYAETAPDVCLSTVEAAEALGFRRAT